MSDETQTPGAGSQGTGQQTNLSGTASEWSTVPSPQPPPPPAAPPDPPAQSLEPLPPAPSAAAGGYQPVYGSGPGAAASGGYTPPPPQQGPPPPGYGGGPGPQYPPPPPPPSAAQGLSSNGAAALSYITFIPAVLFLMIEPYSRDRFVRFHSWQSISLWIVAVGIRIIFYVLSAMSFHVLWWLFLLIRMAIGFVLFVFWLIALIKASQGQWYKIPIVGDLATSFSGGQQ